MEEERPSVLIVDDDSCDAMVIAKKLEDSADVIVVGENHKAGHAGYGRAYAQALAMAVIAEPYMLHNPFAPGIRKLFKPTKGKTKCINPSCEEYTTHNSGYCSKECKVENQRRINRKTEEEM